MKKTFKEFEEMRGNKEDLKFKCKRGWELEKRIDKLIKIATNILPKAYHDLIYLHNINFQLYDVDADISKYANQWVTKVENISRIEHEEISDESW